MYALSFSNLDPVRTAMHAYNVAYIFLNNMAQYNTQQQTVMR